MAHSCPDCGLNCHCNGDIDDCELDGTLEQMRCKHCENKAQDYDEEPADEEPKPLPKSRNYDLF